MSRNIFCGSVRIVYAIIYTLFLVRTNRISFKHSTAKNRIQGFGLTIGSDFYLVLDRHARRQYYHDSLTTNLTYTHGQFIFSNSTSLGMVSGVIGTAIHPTHASNSTMALKVVKGTFSAAFLRINSPSYLFSLLDKRLLAGRLLVMVAPTVSLVCRICSCASLFYLFFPFQPSILAKHSTSGHGCVLLCCLRCE